MKPRLLLLELLFLLSLAKLAAGTDRSWPLVSAHAVGSARCSESDIIAAAGLKTGAEVTAEEMKRGADRLVASGAFEQVSYQYRPAGQGIRVDFKVADAEQFQSVSFDNFVWFTDQELTEAIRKRVPLFHGEVPVEGELRTQVTDALQAILAEHAIPGKVNYQLEEEHPGEIAAGAFRVAGIEIEVREVTFPGAAPAEIAALQAAAQPLLQTPFQRSAVVAFTAQHLLPVYQRSGFLKARFGQPGTKLASDYPRHPAVSLSLPSTPGVQYRLGAVRWSGNKALPALELKSLLTAPVGAPANSVALRKDMESVVEAYRRRGYLRASVHPLETFDDSAAVVSYELQVTEGDLYHFAHLELEGVDPPLRDRVREAWGLREGEPYDPAYIKTFLAAASPLLGPGAVTHAQQDINDQTKTVEVFLRFEFQQPIESKAGPSTPGKK